MWPKRSFGGVTGAHRAMHPTYLPYVLYTLLATVMTKFYSLNIQSSPKARNGISASRRFLKANDFFSPFELNSL